MNISLYNNNVNSVSKKIYLSIAYNVKQALLCYVREVT